MKTGENVVVTLDLGEREELEPKPISDAELAAIISIFERLEQEENGDYLRANKGWAK